MTNITRFTIEAQGSRVTLGRNGTVSKQQKTKQATRGVVKDFSPRSRSRLLRLVASFDVEKAAKDNPVIFLTLTYGQLYPTDDYAKRHIQTLIKRLVRFAPDCSGLWRVELQKRGAPHFHVMVFGLPFLDKLVLAAAWGAVIGQEFWDTSTIEKFGVAVPPFTRIEAIRNTRKAFGYVSKYVAKLPDNNLLEQSKQAAKLVVKNIYVVQRGGSLVDTRTGEIVGVAAAAAVSTAHSVLSEDGTEWQGGSEAAQAASGFNNVPYLTVDKSSSESSFENEPSSGWSGRHWGVFNRAKLPFGELLSMVVEVEPENMAKLERVFFQFRRGMSKKWGAANKFGRGKGATIFAWSAAHRWYELFEFYLLQELWGGGIQRE